MARDAIKPLLQEPTQRVAELMAEIEQRESGDEGRAREWMARALRAPRDPEWTADGFVSDRWMPVSPVSGRLDAFQWKVPLAEIADRREVVESEERPPVIDLPPPEAARRRKARGKACQAAPPNPRPRARPRSAPKLRAQARAGDPAAVGAGRSRARARAGHRAGTRAARRRPRRAAAVQVSASARLPCNADARWLRRARIFRHFRPVPA